MGRLAVGRDFKTLEAMLSAVTRILRRYIAYGACNVDKKCPAVLVIQARRVGSELLSCVCVGAGVFVCLFVCLFVCVRVRVQDWTGMDDYEMERARMLADLGYVGFAADIYGRGTPVEDRDDWAAAAGRHRGDPTLYMSKINAALEQVKSYSFVDTSKIAVIGYCFGGTGIVNMAILGVDVLGVVGYHSGIQPNRRVLRSDSTGPVRAKVLLHSGVQDDLATDIALLEREFEDANATFEIVRYGSDVLHTFTNWYANDPGVAVYNQRADVRSWESTKLFLSEIFEGLSDTSRRPFSTGLGVSLPEYSCNSSVCQSYMVRNPAKCSSENQCPTVIIVPDWTGMDDYEMERARMLADLGYVGFAADIYGRGTPVEDRDDWAAAAGRHRGDPTLYMSKINAALEQMKSYSFVDTSKIAVIGYCFGGTGIVNMAILGVDVLGVVGYHSGIQPNRRVLRSDSTGPVRAKVLLHSGVQDDLATDIALLEREFEDANATFEIVRYGSDVLHTFTNWYANDPGVAVYNQRADVRSWESTKLFLSEIFEGLSEA